MSGSFYQTVFVLDSPNVRVADDFQFFTIQKSKIISVTLS